MSKQKRNATLFIILYLAAFYGWLWIYADHSWMRTLGASLFSIIGTAVSIYWLFRPYRILERIHRIFIILITIGIALLLLSNMLWFLNVIINGDSDFPILAFILWLAAYVFFLLALVYKLRLLYTSLSMSPFLFNILIFMIAAIAISIHFIIDPIVKLAFEYQSFIFLFTTYPILDIGIGFLTINIFYMTRDTKEYKAFLFLFLGFLTQIITDTIYLHLLNINQYVTGSLITPLWILATLFIGFTNFHVKIYEEEEKWRSSSYPKQKDTGLFLNLSVIFLAFLVIQSLGWSWNALVFGLILSTIVLVFKQIAMTKKLRGLLHDLWYHAYHDKLTGLLNRASYIKDIEELITFANENQKKFAIMLLDFDRFKNINDTLGHEIGDRLLKECASILKESISENDFVYRLGGDEFIIILQHATKNYCQDIAETILENFSKVLTVNVYQISITPSIGISLFPNNGLTSETLLKNADTSMYLAKSKGRNQYELYSRELNNKVTRKMQLETDLTQAIVNHEFHLYFQPKVDLQSREIIGAEALLRWKHPVLGDITPDEFIPLAEDTGQIVPIGDWVLNKACKQLQKWHRNGFQHISMAINVSVLQFQHRGFLKNVEKALMNSGIDPRNIELEITESIMQNIVDSTRILNELREMGIRISIDDFGTGYSSLSVLKSLPIDSIKIDRSFITDLSETDIAMVRTIMNIGFNLNLDVVVEGIEYEDQVTALLEISNHQLYGQGYLFGKPKPADEFEQFFMEKKK
jgi:diguanylate cyclase (GGDEF)-like protein